MVKKRLKLDIVFFIWLLLTAIWNVVSVFVGIGNLTSFSYMALTLCWVWSLRREIPDGYIRRRLQFGGVLLFMLFVCRLLRWNVAVTGSFVDRFLWYLYYVTTLVTPLLSFSISIHIGNRDRDKAKRFLYPFWFVCALFCIIALTNDLHGRLLRIWYENGEEHSSAGVFFYIFLFWSFGLMLSAFIIMLYKCRISAVKRNWWLPTIWEGTALLLWIIYYINMGSSPKIAGISLYNIQEVYMLLFLGLWENYIRIGFIPSLSLIRERDWIREGILNTVSGELDQIRALHRQLPELGDAQFGEHLIKMSCLGAYVKRRANLELIADGRRSLNVGELSLSIRESFDYYSLAGLSVGYEETGKGDIPALLILCAYELFEEVLERAQSACYVKVQISQTQDNVGFRMEVETDPYPEDRGEVEKREWIARDYLDVLGATIRMSEEDDTRRMTLDANYPIHQHPMSTIRRILGENDLSHGLSGLADFLSLEKEALEAKTSIHDNLGRCLLLTRRYLDHPEEISREEIFEEWGRVLSGVQVSPSDSAAEDDRMIGMQDVIDKARAMGIGLETTGELTEDARLISVIDAAVTVHVTNILKHTDGNRAFLHMEKKEDGYCLTLTDDGSAEGQIIAETGGLKNLRSQVESLGGTMEVSGNPRFSLRIQLPVPSDDR